MRTIPVRVAGRVALVQPAVSTDDKWVAANRGPILDDLVALSRAALDSTPVGLVAWPEAAVSYFFPNPRVEARIGALAADAHTPLLVGAVDVHWFGTGPGDYEEWNAAFLFDSTGSRAGQPVYHKRYLVPITERVPFLNPRWFHLRFFGGFAVGALGDLFHIGMGRFGVIICYEDAFENLPRRYRSMGAAFLVNITNDAWFGETAGPRQHLAHLVMRAIENRVGVARAANTGISGFVDPLGRIYDRTRLGEHRFVVGSLLTSDAQTPYTRLGDWVGLLSLVGSAVVIGFAWWRRR
jgi:apolipoprotein N-acyltransferase